MSNVSPGLWELVESYVAAEAVELDDLELRGRGGGRILRVTIDAEEGVDAERIADLSRGLSRLLDEHGALPGGAFTLEVSSPGLERALRRPSHYDKSVGREVIVRTHRPVGGATSHRGTLDEVDGQDVVLRVNGGSRRIPFREVASARTVFRWEKAPKPGRQR
ncbi:MAG: ribosome maturation factor RimP [Acidimicrobiia bacterium]